MVEIEAMKQGAIACQHLAYVAHYMANVNGGVNNKDVASTVYWQEKQAHWRRLAMTFLFEVLSKEGEVDG